jgi:hypothetical protein
MLVVGLKKPKDSANAGVRRRLTGIWETVGQYPLAHLASKGAYNVGGHLWAVCGEGQSIGFISGAASVSHPDPLLRANAGQSISPQWITFS